MFKALKLWFHKHLGVCKLSGKARIEPWMPIDYGYKRFCLNPLCDHVKYVRHLSPCQEIAMKERIEAFERGKEMLTKECEKSVANLATKANKPRRAATRN